jgi:glutamyl-tRNA synthetase
MNVVTRFAPSPTGYMHVGGVRTALYAWLFARKQGGRFILRIEDTDKEREVAGSSPHIIESLTWLGIEWDEGVDKGGPRAPYLQSERLALYRSYAERLITAGHAYADASSEAELDILRKQAEAEHRPFLFRDHRPATPLAWDGSTPLRFRVPELKRCEWHDVVRGTLSAGPEALDDFILIKSDGYPTYNFAHIVDDIEMGVTHVMRGEEFISSTPKYLALYEALSITPPVFVTMPPILGPDGKKKLSKRDGAKDILDYRTEGYLPEAMMNFLALLGWNPGTEQEFFSPQELIDAFTLERIQKSGAHFDEAKLLSVNQHWMRELSDEQFLANLDFVNPDTHEGFTKSFNPAILRKAIPLMKDRAQTFAEARAMLAGELSCLFTAPTIDPAILVAKESPSAQGSTVVHLAKTAESVSTLGEALTVEEIKSALMPYADANPKESGGRGAVLWPLRYALSGQEKSPDPFTLISILGREESRARIERALAILKK